MFHQKLADLRSDRDLTQQELADALNVNVNTYGAYERGINRAPDEFKADVAVFFNVSLDYLLGLIPHPRPLHANTGEYFRLPAPLGSDSLRELGQYAYYLADKEKKQRKQQAK
ncbi:MAG: helix-turn-helix domain-containing protein [Oscillospiraceae bacterium]|nr:helix-turn-helix domain-containing protein [Oscillospiraceae bacterium]